MNPKTEVDFSLACKTALDAICPAVDLLALFMYFDSLESSVSMGLENSISCHSFS